MTHTSFIDGETLVLTVTLADADAAIIPPQSVQTAVCDTDTTTYATGEAATAVYYATPSGDAEITDLSVGTSGSGADVIISSTSITAGEPVRINSGFHEVPLDLA